MKCSSSWKRGQENNTLEHVIQATTNASKLASKFGVGRMLGFGPAHHDHHYQVGRFTWFHVPFLTSAGFHSRWSRILLSHMTSACFGWYICGKLSRDSIVRTLKYSKVIAI